MKTFLPFFAVFQLLVTLCTGLSYCPGGGLSLNIPCDAKRPWPACPPESWCYATGSVDLGAVYFCCPSSPTVNRLPLLLPPQPAIVPVLLPQPYYPWSKSTRQRKSHPHTNDDYYDYDYEGHIERHTTTTETGNAAETTETVKQLPRPQAQQQRPQAQQQQLPRPQAQQQRPQAQQQQLPRPQAQQQRPQAHQQQQQQLPRPQAQQQQPQEQQQPYPFAPVVFIHPATPPPGYNGPIQQLGPGEKQELNFGIDQQLPFANVPITAQANEYDVVHARGSLPDVVYTRGPSVEPSFAPPIRSQGGAQPRGGFTGDRPIYNNFIHGDRTRLPVQQFSGFVAPPQQPWAQNPQQPWSQNGALGGFPSQWGQNTQQIVPQQSLGVARPQPNLGPMRGVLPQQNLGIGVLSGQGGLPLPLGPHRGGGGQFGGQTAMATNTNNNPFMFIPQQPASNLLGGGTALLPGQTIIRPALPANGALPLPMSPQATNLNINSQYPYYQPRPQLTQRKAPLDNDDNDNMEWVSNPLPRMHTRGRSNHLRHAHK